MSSEDFNKIFAKNIREQLDKNGMTQKELAAKLGVALSTVGYWCNAVKTPRMDKVDNMCKLFHCERDDLMTEHTEEYYTNKRTAEVAQKITENRELGLLFEAAADASAEDLETVHQMLLALKRKEQGG